MSDELSSQPLELIVPDTAAGMRLDQFLAQHFTAYSRVLLRKVINAAAVKVDDQRTKASHRLNGGERLNIFLPEIPREGPQPEKIPLDILYEDEHLAVINKPPGMVVHPAKGHWAGTLASALQFHFDQLSASGGANRPGIVHRLDRDTSGVIAIAKTDAAHMRLAEQFESRSVEKEYFAIVIGVPSVDRDVIDQPIGPHPYQREKKTIRHDHPESRPAQTFYEVLERFEGFACVKVLPKTGRTHQIRLHLSHIGCPVLCDRLYGSRARLTLGELMRRTADETIILERQALHARRLKFSHPITGTPVECIAELPDDLQRTVLALREHRKR
jgi:23S rRNA pseudouridine1911/1915/1917 synthase